MYFVKSELLPNLRRRLRTGSKSLFSTSLILPPPPSWPLALSSPQSMTFNGRSRLCGIFDVAQQPQAHSPSTQTFQTSRPPRHPLPTGQASHLYPRHLQRIIGLAASSPNSARRLTSTAPVGAGAAMVVGQATHPTTQPMTHSISSGSQPVSTPR